MILLENEYISASFSQKGAELQSFKNKSTGMDYLWNGDSRYWGKHSPMLFPIVGGLKDNTYYTKGQAYHLPRHGFARDREFSAEKTSDTCVTFTLSEDEESLKVYPFPFSLSLVYQIEGTRLSCTYQVTNTGTETLPFSAGGHPAFAAPTGGGISYDDYFLEFNKDTVLRFHKISSDLISDETVAIKLEDQCLPLSHQLFYEDALVFKTLQSDRISLRNHKNSHGIDFEFKGFPFFGIWAAKDADFVCLEPWCGIADGINHDQQLETKEGIEHLGPQEKWERTWSVRAF